jgi:hypothetical protein
MGSAGSAERRQALCRGVVLIVSAVCCCRLEERGRPNWWYYSTTKPQISGTKVLEDLPTSAAASVSLSHLPSGDKDCRLLRLALCAAARVAQRAAPPLLAPGVVVSHGPGVVHPSALLAAFSAFTSRCSRDLISLLCFFISSSAFCKLWLRCWLCLAATRCRDAALLARSTLPPAL